MTLFSLKETSCRIFLNLIILLVRTKYRSGHFEKFAGKNDWIKKGNPIINLGIGSPDLLPPSCAIEALKNSLNDQYANNYQSYIGLEDLRISISKFYNKWFDVDLDFNSEILPLMGSKEGIMHISMAFLNIGDSVLIPNPGYPTYSSVTNLAQANPIYYDLKAHNSRYH